MAAVAAGADAGLAVNRLANEVAAEIDAAAALDPDAFCRWSLMEGERRADRHPGQDGAQATCSTDGGDPAAIAGQLGFEAMAADAVADGGRRGHRRPPGEWDRYVGGEDKLQGLFVGKVKAATQGKADLKAVAALLQATPGPAPGSAPPMSVLGGDVPAEPVVGGEPVPTGPSWNRTLP